VHNYSLETPWKGGLQCIEILDGSLHFLPGGREEMSGSPTKKIHFVLKGEIMVKVEYE
jgi:hypothetical protein